MAEAGVHAFVNPTKPSSFIYFMTSISFLGRFTTSVAWLKKDYITSNNPAVK